MEKAVLFKSYSENYHNSFQRVGIETIFIECLQFVFKNIELLERKLSFPDYDGLILTSPRAIEALARCLQKDSLWNDKKVYVVGESSGAQIKRLLNLSASGVESGNSDILADLISKENSKGAKFLFPCGNLRTETIIKKLEEVGIQVDPITVYETEENENLKIEIDNLVKDNRRFILAFFSPSGVQFVINNFKNSHVDYSKFMYFAIGTSTSKKLQQVGIKVDGVALQPSSESLAEIISSVIANS